MAVQQTRILAALEAGGTIRPATTETTSAFARLRPDYTGNKFEFPSYSVWTMWGLWWFGNSRDDIGPLQYVRPTHHCVGRSSGPNSSRTAKVMSALVRMACDEGIIRGEGEITLTNSSRVFDAVYPKLIAILYD